jgi:L-iditol 2-dehydrogenase
MKAFVYRKAGESRLEEYARPRAARDSAVIRVLACSVCGTDLRAWQHGNERITPPRINGHELCGRIEEIGPDCAGFAVGDRVSVVPAIGCGQCPSCRKGYTNLCDNLQTIGFQFDGGFAEYMEVPAVACASPGGIRWPSSVRASSAACTRSWPG